MTTSTHDAEACKTQHREPNTCTIEPMIEIVETDEFIIIVAHAGWTEDDWEEQAVPVLSQFPLSGWEYQLVDGPACEMDVWHLRKPEEPVSE